MDLRRMADAQGQERGVWKQTRQQPAGTHRHLPIVVGRDDQRGRLNLAWPRPKFQLGDELETPAPYDALA
jgi:hypothetical protein